jgi:hypothetical protein
MGSGRSTKSRGVDRMSEDDLNHSGVLLLEGTPVSAFTRARP